MSLTGPRFDAKSGSAKSLVIFLHGYGADGKDLLGLGEMLSEHLPDTTFLAPNAPDPCINNPAGYQWFNIPWLDGTSEVEMGKAFARSVELLNAWLDETLEAEGRAASETVLVGFSQGTMMSLHVGPRREEEFAGIVGFSGRLIHPGLLEAELKTKPPILLIHGDQDEIVPPSSMPEAKTALEAAGLNVETHVSTGVGHGIAPDGLGLALEFIQTNLKV